MKKIFFVLLFMIVAAPFAHAFDPGTYPYNTNNNPSAGNSNTQIIYVTSNSNNGGELSRLRDANDVLVRAASIMNALVYFLVAIAVVYIVYNVVWYMIKPDGSESRREAGMGVLWGIVGLFIIVSIWGLVNILTNTLSTDNTMPSDRVPTSNFLKNL